MSLLSYSIFTILTLFIFSILSFAISPQILKIVSKRPNPSSFISTQNLLRQRRLQIDSNQIEAESIVNQSPYKNEQSSGQFFYPNIYGLPVALGSKKNKATLLLDTGSSWTWIPSGNNYQCSNSSTCNFTDISTSYSSYNGNVSGQIAFDTLTVGSLVIPNSSFIIANSFSSISIYNEFSYPVYNGVLGLGFQSDTSYLNIVDTLYNNNNITNDLFSLYVTGNPYLQEQNSVLYFGGYDTSLMTTGDINYINLVQNASSWTFEFTEYQMGSWGRYNSTLNQATVVSGSQFIGLPQSDFNNLYSQFQNKFNCTFDINNNLACQCPYGNISNFQNISLVVSDNLILSIPTWAYIIYNPSLFYNIMIGANDSMAHDNEISEYFYEEEAGPYGGYLGPYYSYGSLINYGDYCQILLEPTNDTTWILGTPFLQNYYTIFSKGDKNLGFALAYQPDLEFYVVIDNDSSMATWWIYVLGIPIFVVIIGIMIKQFCTKKKKTEVDNNNPDLQNALWHANNRNL